MAAGDQGQTFGNRPTGSIAEDVTDIIYQITPEDTPFFQMIGDGKATDVVHQWLVRSLTTRQSNKATEGFGYTFPTPNRLPTRKDNLCQILTKEVRVSETHQAVSHYAISDLFADQMEAAMVELKTDIEHALLTATKASGATGTAREMGGLLQSIQAFNASLTFTNFTNAVTLTETLFNQMIQRAWEEGGAPKDALMHGRLKRAISTFTDGHTKFIAADEQRSVRTISVYESDFFTVNTHLSRDMPTTAASGHDLVLVDRTMCKKSWLRPVTARRVPETADSADGVLKTELTLEIGNGLAHYYAKQIAPGIV